MVVKKTKTKARSTKKKAAPKTQSFKANNNFKAKLEKILKDGNARRIVIKNKKNKVLAHFPLTFGVVGVILAPIFAAIAAIVALAKDCTITVERD